jgi:hypothetical protein
MFKNLGDRWAAIQPRAMWLVIGLVVGPFISSFAGWQVTSSNARAQVRAGVVEQQAMVCESRARAENATPGALDWNARQDLAKRSAQRAPGASEDYEVTRACADRLRA